MEIYMTPEREEYIRKLEAQRKAVASILKMEAGTIISPDLRKQLRNLLEEVETVLKKLQNDEFEIAVVGMEKAGKSTFANALIKTKLLPAKGPRCTFTSTRIEYCGDNHDENAVVSFYTPDTFNQDFKDKLHTLGFPNFERYSFDTLEESVYQKIYEQSVSQDTKKAYGNNIHEDILAIIRSREVFQQLLGRPQMNCGIHSEDLAMYITDGVKARAVKQVFIRSKELGEMKNAVIFDVPGFNSPTELHKVQTRERMKAADAIVVVANGSKPSLTEESLKILNEFDDEGNQLSDKLFVFANRVEDVSSAEDLEENIQDTYREWCDRQRFIPAGKKDRITFGSALAYLQAKELEVGDNALHGLQNWQKHLPDGDGIEEVRRKLVKYNRTERFHVLKRRVNRIQANILKIFSGICGGSTENQSFGPEHMQMVVDICHHIPPAAEEGLLALKKQIRSIPERQPLSTQITEYISQNVTTEKYAISDELVEEIRLETPYIITSDDWESMEPKIREKKFEEMYDDFSNHVINIADQHHADCSEQILETVLKAIGVETSSPYYEDLKQNLRGQFAPYRGGELLSSGESSGIYYQSLIERFSRDLYEVLITRQYSEARWGRFQDSMDNFLSMSVFYKNPDLPCTGITPQEHPMCKMILFHHYFNMAGTLRRLLDELGGIAGVRELSPEAQEYLQQAFTALDGSAGKILQAVTKAFRKVTDQPEEFRQNLMKSTLHSLRQNAEPCGIDEPEAFTSYYRDYHSKLKGGKPYSAEDVRREFNTDIEILQDVLLHAFVYAVNMEKPFVAREIKSIDDIIKYIRSDVFSNFLAGNLRKIKYQETARLDQQQRAREQDAAIVQEISGILNTLNQ
ncbi:MAG: dynamin family protein [Oscillospiraceae bacterium]|nr:dynamin family protein [Oscillospiraceae bacterium]